MSPAVTAPIHKNVRMRRLRAGGTDSQVSDQILRLREKIMQYFKIKAMFTQHGKLVEFGNCVFTFNFY